MSTPTPAPRNRSLSLVVVICLTVVALGLITASVVLVATHHDPTPVLTALGAVLAAGIPGVAALGKTQEVGAAVSVVQHQTNGNMSRLLDIAERVVGAQIETAMTAHTTAQQAIAAIAEPAHPPQDPTPGHDVGPPPSSPGTPPGSPTR